MKLTNYLGNIEYDVVERNELDAAIKNCLTKTYSNIPVNVTPVALSDYCAWDTQQLYGYKATITINGLTDNSLIQNIIMTDTLLASIGYIATTGSNSLTFYTQDDTPLSGTIITLVTSEVF